MIGLFAVVGVWAALGRKSDGSLFSTLPTIIGSIAAGVALWFLHGRIATPAIAEADPADGAAGAVAALEMPAIMQSTSDRRRFLAGSGALLGATAAGAAVLGLGGRQLSRRRFSAAGSRKNVTVPTAEESLPPLPTGVQADVPGMTPFVTPNDRFYRVDTALEVPQLTTESYSLKVKGMVDNEIELSWQDLINRPMIERDVTLTCVSNTVGGSYVGNARWIGARLDDLLREAGPTERADMVVGRSADGWECGFPLENALDGRDAIIAVAMNGEALPLEHGFPGPPGRAGPLRLRVGDEVADRDRAHPLRRVRALLGEARLGREGPDQADEPHRRTQGARQGACRRRGHRRCRMAADTSASRRSS